MYLVRRFWNHVMYSLCWWGYCVCNICVGGIVDDENNNLMSLSQWGRSQHPLGVALWRSIPIQWVNVVCVMCVNVRIQWCWTNEISAWIVFITTKCVETKPVVRMCCDVKMDWWMSFLLYDCCLLGLLCYAYILAVFVPILLLRMSRVVFALIHWSDMWNWYIWCRY